MLNPFVPTKHPLNPLNQFVFYEQHPNIQTQEPRSRLLHLRIGRNCHWRCIMLVDGQALHPICSIVDNPACLESWVFVEKKDKCR